MSHENNDMNEQLIRQSNNNRQYAVTISGRSFGSISHNPGIRFFKVQPEKAFANICERVLNKVRRKMLPETPDPEVYLASDFEN